MIRVTAGGGYHPVTEVTITGSEAEVLSDIAHYFDSFPRPGYMTYITQEPVELGGGIWEAKMQRSTTCE